jgi:translation initiation factor 1A
MKTKIKRARARRNKQAIDAVRDRELVVREDGQVYARVMRLLGGGRLMARCDDGRERTCRIRGSMIRRDWIRAGDAVLVALRSFDDDKADVVHKYNPDEVTRLERMGEMNAADINGPEEALGDVVRFATDESDDDELDMGAI